MSNSTYRVGIIGNFNKNKIGGQIVKSLELYNYLEKNFPNKIKKFDVSYYKKNYMQLFIELIELFKYSHNIIIILATPGYCKVITAIKIINIFYKRHIFEFVIGGIRHQIIKDKKILIKLLKKNHTIIVESTAMQRAYKDLGINNCIFIPNFKKINLLEPKQYNGINCINCCTFSRINESKGIQDAIEVIKLVNSDKKYIIKLDIYGPIEEGYKDKADALFKEMPINCCYCGCINGDNAKILSKYDVLLFPTKWKAEGCPGTFIDAFSVGLPVLSYYNENFIDILKEGETGFLISSGQIQDMKNKLDRFFEQPGLLNSMKWNCYRSAKRYDTEVALKALIARLK